MRCRCRAGSTPIAVAKSGGEGGGSEKCLRNRLRGSKRGSSDGQKRAVGTPLISLGPALVAEFVVSREGEAYDAQARGLDRKFRVELVHSLDAVAHTIVDRRSSQRHYGLPKR